MFLLGAGVATFIALVVLVHWSRSVSAENERRIADKTYALEFVVIEDDGNARELTEDEMLHLNTRYVGADGARPYIKWRYKSLTPDKKIGGYLRRRHLPRGMPIRRL